MSGKQHIKSYCQEHDLNWFRFHFIVSNDVLVLRVLAAMSINSVLIKLSKSTGMD